MNTHAGKQAIREYGHSEQFYLDLLKQDAATWTEFLEETGVDVGRVFMILSSRPWHSEQSVRDDLYDDVDELINQFEAWLKSGERYLRLVQKMRSKWELDEAILDEYFGVK